MHLSIRFLRSYAYPVFKTTKILSPVENVTNTIKNMQKTPPNKINTKQKQKQTNKMKVKSERP